MKPRREPRPHLPHYDHEKPCQCNPCSRDATGALVLLLSTACECAQKWGWSEQKLIRLLRICWAWERDGKIPERLDEDKAA